MTPQQEAYRNLVSECADMEPLHGFTDVSELTELTMEDLALVCLAKDLPVHTVTQAKLALLSDIQSECDDRNARRAKARDDERYGSDRWMTDRERAEHDFGVRSLFR